MPRPMIYEPLYKDLDPSTLYCPGGIVDKAIQDGSFLRIEHESDDLKKSRSRARVAVTNFGRRNLPDKCDGYVRFGRRHVPAWWGARWLLALPILDDDERSRLESILARLEADAPPIPPVINDPEPDEEVQEEEEDGESERTVWQPEESENIRPAFPLFSYKAVDGRYSFGRWFMLVAMASLLAGIFGVSYQDDYRRWFEAYVSGKTLPVTEIDEGPGLRFGRAYDLYKLGRYEESAISAYNLLKESNDSNLHARIYYLIGNVNYRRGDYQNSLDAYDRAIDLFQGLGSDANQYRTMIQKGQSLAEMDELDLAEALANEAEDFLNVHLPGREDLKGYLFRLRMELAAHQYDFETALEEAERRHICATLFHDKVELASALSDIGLYSMLVGDTDTGFEKTLEASHLIIEMGDSRAHYYNELNWYVYALLDGKPEAGIEERLLEWSRNSEDKKLRNMVHFLKRLNLGSKRGGTNDMPPEPDGHERGGTNDMPPEPDGHERGGTNDMPPEPDGHERGGTNDMPPEPDGHERGGTNDMPPEPDGHERGGTNDMPPEPDGHERGGTNDMPPEPDGHERGGTNDMPPEPDGHERGGTNDMPPEPDGHERGGTNDMPPEPDGHERGGTNDMPPEPDGHERGGTNDMPPEPDGHERGGTNDMPPEPDGHERGGTNDMPPEPDGHERGGTNDMPPEPDGHERGGTNDMPPEPDGHERGGTNDMPPEPDGHERGGTNDMPPEPDGHERGGTNDMPPEPDGHERGGTNDMPPEPDGHERGGTNDMPPEPDSEQERIGTNDMPPEPDNEQERIGTNDMPPEPD